MQAGLYGCFTALQAIPLTQLLIQVHMPTQSSHAAQHTLNAQFHLIFYHVYAYFSLLNLSKKEKKRERGKRKLHDIYQNVNLRIPKNCIF